MKTETAGGSSTELPEGVLKSVQELVQRILCVPVGKDLKQILTAHKKYTDYVRIFSAAYPVLILGSTFVGTFAALYLKHKLFSSIVAHDSALEILLFIVLGALITAMILFPIFSRFYKLQRKVDWEMYRQYEKLMECFTGIHEIEPFGEGILSPSDLDRDIEQRVNAVVFKVKEIQANTNQSDAMMHGDPVQSQREYLKLLIDVVVRLELMNVTRLNSANMVEDEESLYKVRSYCLYDHLFNPSGRLSPEARIS